MVLGVDLKVAVNSAVSDKTNVTVNYTVTNLGSTTSAPFNVDVWSNSASAPTVGSTGQSTVAISPLAGGASYTGSVAIANATVTGTLTRLWTPPVRLRKPTRATTSAPA